MPATVLVFAIACRTPEEAGAVPSYIAPLDGQTGIPEDLPLFLAGAAADTPPEYPVADSVRVVDLETGGFVPGATERDGDDILFFPNHPWHKRRAYAWAIDQPVANAHGPEGGFPDALPGVALFQTTQTLELLGAAMDAGRACLILSQSGAPLPANPPQISVDDGEVHAASVVGLRQATWDPGFELLEDDPYVDVWCIADASIAPGQTLRVWWGDFGPWHFTVSAGSLPELIGDLRRASL
jgi:hypothetical protein